MTKKQRIEMLRNRWLSKIEENKVTPLLIVPRETQPISNEAYYEGCNFKEPWDVQGAILERVQREDSSRSLSTVESQ